MACEGKVAHVVVMPNITIPKLEQFVADLIDSRTRHFLKAAMQVATDARERHSSDNSDSE